jgi:hypothetical protein
VTPDSTISLPTFIAGDQVMAGVATAVIAAAVPRLRAP